MSRAVVVSRSRFSIWPLCVGDLLACLSLPVCRAYCRALFSGQKRLKLMAAAWKVFRRPTFGAPPHEKKMHITRFTTNHDDDDDDNFL